MDETKNVAIVIAGRNVNYYSGNYYSTDDKSNTK